MLQFQVDKTFLGLIEGERGFIVTEKDFCHGVFSFDETYLTLTLPELKEICEPEPVDIDGTRWGHYWGIKQRVKENYHGLLVSMREIGADTGSMPKWPSWQETMKRQGVTRAAPEKQP